MANKSMGSTLRSLREKTNLTVKDVIIELEKHNQQITDKTLYSYENGTRVASADMFLSLCEIYHCNNILEVFSDVEIDYSVPDDSEWTIIEKYRELDTHGKEMVDFTLSKEWERSTALKEEENKIVNFADSQKPLEEGDAAHLRTDIVIPEGIDTSDNEHIKGPNF